MFSTDGSGGSGAATKASERQAFNEFQLDDFQARPHYRPLWEAMRKVGQATLVAKAREADLALRTEGVTFTVYGDDERGIERVWPFDLIPRIVPAAEWRRIETGLKQRVVALNLFLHDLYHGQQILRDRVVPAEVIYSGKHYLHELSGIEPPGRVYTHVSGIDLVRDEDGRYLVLEDNLRTPSGVSYMIENRMVERRVLPELFHSYRVRRVEHYPAILLQALRHVSPRGKDAAEIVLLTPGIYNTAYFEHTFLAKEMGIELVEGRDLVVAGDIVYTKTTQGLRRVDVIYRRVDDAFLDPLYFRADSTLGVAGLVNAWRAGNVAIANALGNGVADDKGVYPYVPDIIRYYLDEQPILDNVPTMHMTRTIDREHVLANLERFVVKPVGESGGYGILIGPQSTAAEREECTRSVRADPRNYIAQPVVMLSRHVCQFESGLEARHIDLRPFIVYGAEPEVIAGGLTRVALVRGSLIVNSSQGGGSKDTWVLDD